MQCLYEYAISNNEESDFKTTQQQTIQLDLGEEMESSRHYKDINNLPSEEKLNTS